MLWLLLVTLWGTWACDETRDVNIYQDIVELPDGIQGVNGAEWSYRSFEVDVDLRLETEEIDGSCTTTAWLTIDKANASERRYRLPSTPCDTLRLTLDGDVVLFGEATGIDWTQELLRVDEDNEVVWLGPAWPPGDSEGESITLRISISACEDDPTCECGTLRRLSGATSRTLELSRACR